MTLKLMEPGLELLSPSGINSPPKTLDLCAPELLLKGSTTSSSLSLWGSEASIEWLVVALCEFVCRRKYHGWILALICNDLSEASDFCIFSIQWVLLFTDDALKSLNLLSEALYHLRVDELLRVLYQLVFNRSRVILLLLLLNAWIKRISGSPFHPWWLMD